MAKLSLQDQLLKAGLVNEKKLTKAQKSKKKSRTLAREVKAGVEASKAEQQERAKALNEQQKEQNQNKEIQAQIKQLIQMNKLDLSKATDIKYNFTQGSKIHFLYVPADIRDQLLKGILAVVKFEDGFVVIPNSVAKKIALRDSSIIIENKTAEEDVLEEDDPYADFVVPDDLMW
ncbi:DUF2058 domain-containing protein [Glaciecola sp. 2405UD65-10]|jgi:uncharacterized protein YaiL (DUF2058 family)|uniref:DUF2058 domain-containing protein n=1 Tax=Glaciecola sp. 2405UD65-10 TaxID=3397244 RepID=UPI003B5C1729